MSATGILRVRAYASNAEIPIRDVAVVITADDGTALAMRLTDRNGLTRPVEIPVPEKSESQEPGSPEKPYTTVNLYVQRPGYEPIDAEGIQIFADTETYQDLEMIPLSEFPNPLDPAVDYDTPPQDL